MNNTAGLHLRIANECPNYGVHLSNLEILELSLVSTELESGVFAYSEKDEARSMLLKHRDVLYVRSNPNFIPQQHVEIQGEVLFPGAYALQKENESLGDLIQRAGGILPNGFAQGGRLIRGGQRVVVSFDEILAGDTRSDVVMLDGDRIIIPIKPNTVEVRGNVGIEGLIKYRQGEKVRYYLEQAGDILEDSDQILLTQATGATQRLKTRLFFFKQNPVVDDGATIMVIPKEELAVSEQTDLKTILGESMAWVTSVLTMLLLVQRIKGHTSTPEIKQQIHSDPQIVSNHHWLFSSSINP